MANRKNDLKKMKGYNINLIAAGVTGAVIGASIAVVGAIAMRDEKASEKIMDVIKTVGDKASEYIDDMKVEATHQLVEKADETASEVKKTINEMN